MRSPSRNSIASETRRNAINFLTFTPRSIEDRDYWESLKNRPHLRDFLDATLNRAEEAPGRPEMPLASDFLAARRHNDRGRLDHHWQGVVPKWTSLIVRRRE